MIRLLFILSSLSLILVACADHASVDGGAGSDGGGGHVRIGWPF